MIYEQKWKEAAQSIAKPWWLNGKEISGSVMFGAH
jgi:hypothetical protein